MASSSKRSKGTPLWERNRDRLTRSAFDEMEGITETMRCLNSTSLSSPGSLATVHENDYDEQREIMEVKAEALTVFQTRFKPPGVAEKLEEAIRQLPGLLALEMDVVESRLEKVFPDWHPCDYVNVAVAMSNYKRKIDSMKRSSIKHTGFAHSPTASYQNKGAELKTASIDPELLLKAVTGKEIWKENQWEDICHKSQNKLEDQIAYLIKTAKFNKLELVFVGDKDSVCGSLRPDALIKLRGYRPSHFTTCAIISVHSFGRKKAFDTDFAIGQLCTYGQVFLNMAGPERDSLILGITDLQQVLWYKLTRDQSEVVLGGFKVVRSPCISQVRVSLQKYLQVEPAFFGIDMALRILKTPKTWREVRFLGCGKTSNVYQMEYNGKFYALKVPLEGHSLRNDIHYLNLLTDVDGVPSIYSTLNLMIALQPVCRALHPSAISSCPSFGFLVDILQYAHKKGIVNRDVRPENIMIGQGLDKKRDRLFLLDWGFAAECDVETVFEGSLVTASDFILDQFCSKKVTITYRCADDLVSLVRCLFLLYNSSFASELHHLGTDCSAIKSVWKSRMQKNRHWADAEELCFGCSNDGVRDTYADLKNCLVNIQRNASSQSRGPSKDVGRRKTSLAARNI